MFSASVFAQKISYSEAQKVAENYFGSRNIAETSNQKGNSALSYCKIENNDTLLFIFNFGSKGYVIISGDYSLPPILAYSNEGNFVTDAQLPALSDWLESYAKAVANARTSSNKSINSMWNYYLQNATMPVAKTKGIADISPMLTTTWDQSALYNYHCPVFASGPGGHCYAGCVATAMAQVMKFYNFPAHGYGSNSYYHPYFVSISADFDTTYYNWAAMTNAITPSSKEAISTLIYQCGVSVNMDYEPTGSGALVTSVPLAITTHFKYRPTASVAQRSNYNDFDWHNLVVNNLNDRHPLLYSGGNATEGHAFVCDGYMNDSLFHFNWGWSGVNNGYFRLDSLNSGNGDFSMDQSIVLDFVPSDAPYCEQHKILTDPTGTVSDGSGYSYYWNNTDCQWLIQPPSNDSIILSFTQLQTESGKDFVSVYDGTTTGDLLLGTFSGHNIPSQLIAKSGSMLITFTTDSVNQDQGWSANYTTRLIAGINENSISDQISIFPVPAKNEINITFPSAIKGDANINVYSLTGQMVNSKKVSLDGNSIIHYDISSLKPGVYFAEIATGAYRIHKKLIKQ